MKHEATPAPHGDGPADFEPGYLTAERLRPDEIASIEATLAAASVNAVRRRPSRWLGLAAIAAGLVTLLLLFTRSPSGPVEEADASRRQAARPTSMILEIQRIDVADAKPYKLMIARVADESPIEPEVQP